MDNDPQKDVEALLPAHLDYVLSIAACCEGGWLQVAKVPLTCPPLCLSMILHQRQSFGSPSCSLRPVHSWPSDPTIQQCLVLHLPIHMSIDHNRHEVGSIQWRLAPSRLSWVAHAAPANSRIPSMHYWPRMTLSYHIYRARNRPGKPG